MSGMMMVILDHGDMVIADSVHGDHRIGKLKL